MQDALSKVSKIVAAMSGVQLGQKQEAMVMSRLSSRMTKLGIQDMDAYLKHLEENLESESQALLSLMTTHHTYFFREFSHFEFLLNKALHPLIEAARSRPDKTIRVWSAACSTGQEAYSLAMFFRFHLNAVAPDVAFSILATDVDPKSVAHARNGVYKEEELKTSPAMYVSNLWIKGSGSAAGFFKARKDLKDRCRFETLNLFEAESLSKAEKFDLIFCRNVFIYFNEAQIKKLSSSLLGRMEDQGFLVLGISETLMGLGLPASLVGPSTYRKPVAAQALSRTYQAPTAAEKENKVYRVLCVDDSPAIHALLGKILVPEHGFQIAAKAKNGQEALDLLARDKFDAITLDLHMPEVDGVTFLQRHSSREAPILILSSVNRDEASIGQKALALGAFDYVEKPSLENLAQAGNEIRAKLKLGLSNRAAPASPSPAVPRQPSGKIRVLIVDDSATIRGLLRKILNRDPAFEVVGEAEKPSEVEGLLRSTKPDLMTLDIHMPEMDGVTLLKKLKDRHTVPVVMISSISREEGPYVLDALENGAVDYIQKPKLEELAEMSPVICERLKAAARSKVRPKLRGRRALAQTGSLNESALTVIGSSTGGTEALRVIFESMPSKIPPILVVQHIPPVFSKAFADRMDQLCPFEVKEAEDGDEVRPDRVLIAPGGKQMSLRTRNGRRVVEVKDDAPMNRHKPSVDYLFRSLVALGEKNAVVAILTGMGSDGARQMKALRDIGCRTIAQDESTSVVFGMPREAIAQGAAEFVLPLDQIAQKILELSGKDARRKAS